ncbi:hypothetical protein Tco_0207293, partial [Tanacetum coccineum]
DVDLSKDKSGPESPLEFQRSWYVEGHIRSGVISSVLAQQHVRNIPTKGTDLMKDHCPWNDMQLTDRTKRESHARRRRTKLRRNQAELDIYHR